MDKNINCVGKKCYGCGLCVKKCPYDAISLESNEEGFLYPVILEEKCKNCGICKNICPALNTLEKQQSYKEKCYMAIYKDKKVYKKSASGGFATMLSRYVINELNGVVYGCNLDENGNVKHLRADKVEELEKFQDSKYVQSEIIGIFDLIVEDVKNKKTLFIGTPCQVEAIRRLVKDSDNLLTCDLVCHGVPSPSFFKKYLKYLEEKFNSKVKNYTFRNKTSFDKCGFLGKVYLEKNSKILLTDYDLYYKDFLEEKNYRLSCYNCKYKESKRVGDFTIGDVNTWEKYYDFYPELATSLVIVNNSKAEAIFNKITDFIDFREISLEAEKSLNKALSKQTLYPKERDTIYTKYQDLEKYHNEIIHNVSTKQKIKNCMKRIVPFNIRIKTKKIKRKLKR